jgi:hypothetical protein
MLREWRTEADATHDWPTRSATGRGARPFRTRVRPGDEQNRARQCRFALGEETEKADHDGSKRLDKREAPPFQRGNPA